MTHHTEAERVEFEAWAYSVGLDHLQRGFGAQDDYNFVETRRMWAAWQAARRAPAVPVPPDVVRDACARMCDARAESLQAGNMFTAANEAFKCAMAIRTHPAYQHHLRAAMLAAAPQPPDAFQTEGGLKSEIRTTSTAPVQMPEPAGCVVYANGESHHWDANKECAELFASSERSLGAPYAFTFENLYTEQQVRQLLADNGIGKDKA